MTQAIIGVEQLLLSCISYKNKMFQHDRKVVYEKIDYIFLNNNEKKKSKIQFFLTPLFTRLIFTSVFR